VSGMDVKPWHNMHVHVSHVEAKNIRKHLVIGHVHDTQLCFSLDSA